jgi:hypothetical protein
MTKTEQHVFLKLEIDDQKHALEISSSDRKRFLRLRLQSLRDRDHSQAKETAQTAMAMA